MANEAVIIELIEGGCPVRFTCADGTAIAKGTLMEVQNTRTAVATAADNDEFCGIAAGEKVASDGQTSIELWTKGIFDLAASAAVTAGEKVSISGVNTVAKVAAADLLFGDVGVTLEDSAGAETLAVFVGWCY